MKIHLIWINENFIGKRYTYYCVTRSSTDSVTQPGDRDLGQT